MAGTPSITVQRPAWLNSRHMKKITHIFISNLRQAALRFVRCDRGVSAVEMAMISPVLLVVFLGLMDYGIAVFDKMELNSAVRAGSQHALIKSTDLTAIQTTVIGSATLGLTTGDVTVTSSCECSDGSSVSCAGSCASDTIRNYITIQADYTYVPIFLPADLNFSSTSVIRVQ